LEIYCQRQIQTVEGLDFVQEGKAVKDTEVSGPAFSNYLTYFTEKVACQFRALHISTGVSSLFLQRPSRPKATQRAKFFKRIDHLFLLPFSEALVRSATLPF
jgi:hypothetical protein